MSSIIIAHRGLLDGPDSDLQNHPDQITKALGLGFHVEIDVWYIDGIWFLGHDGPEHRIEFEFLIQHSNKLWIHCKNVATFFEIKTNNRYQFNYFFHDTDAVVFTSKSFIWTYFGKRETMHHSSICVMPEVNYPWDEIVQMAKNNSWCGICTDYPRKLQECLE
jgi:hypothetical protein